MEVRMGRQKGSGKEESDARKEEIVALFKKERPSLEEIGRRVGNVSKQYVSQVLREAGLVAQESEDVPVADVIGRVRELSGWTLTDISSIMGVARETVTRWANGKAASSSYARRLDLLEDGLRRANNHRPKAAAKK
jgi:transcriptional regulator with XRE-family HTH domain